MVLDSFIMHQQYSKTGKLLSKIRVKSYTESAILDLGCLKSYFIVLTPYRKRAASVGSEVSSQDKT
jgi:hypothetical protein